MIAPSERTQLLKSNSNMDSKSNKDHESSISDGSAPKGRAPSPWASIRRPWRGRASNRTDSTTNSDEKSSEGGRIQGQRENFQRSSRVKARSDRDNLAAGEGKKDPKNSVQSPRGSFRRPSRGRGEQPCRFNYRQRRQGT